MSEPTKSGTPREQLEALLIDLYTESTLKGFSVREDAEWLLARWRAVDRGPAPPDELLHAARSLLAEGPFHDSPPTLGALERLAYAVAARGPAPRAGEAPTDDFQLPPEGPSTRTVAQQIGDAIDAYNDFCADGMEREVAKSQAVEMIQAVRGRAGEAATGPQIQRLAGPQTHICWTPNYVPLAERQVVSLVREADLRSLEGAVGRGVHALDGTLREAAEAVLRAFEMESCDGKHRRPDYSMCDVCMGDGEESRPETITHAPTCVIGNLRAALRSLRGPDGPAREQLARLLEPMVEAYRKWAVGQMSASDFGRIADSAIVAYDAAVERVSP